MNTVDPYLAGGYGAVHPEDDERTQEPQFEMPQADTTSGVAVEPTKEWDTTLVDDMMKEKESEYSKLRSAGLDKEETKKELTQRHYLRVAAGQDPDKAYTELMGDGSVRWDSEKFEYNEQIRDKVSAISVALGAINIDMVDIVSGKLGEKEKEVLTQLGDHGVKEGWFDYYNINTGMAYTPEGVPIRMNSGGIDDIIAANSGEMAGSIAGGLMLPMMSNPYTAVPAVTLAIVGSMAGAGAGRMGDIRANEARLRKLGIPNKDMNGFELVGEGIDAAVTDGVLAKTIQFIGSKGVSLTKGLFQSLAGRNTKSAVSTIGELTGLSRDAMEKRAKEYARVGGIKWSDNDFELKRTIILRNEIENNPALQGYLTKVVEEPEIANILRQNVKDRTKDLSGTGASTSVDGMLGMVEESNQAAQKMMGSVRGALDDSFKDIPLDINQLGMNISKIREGLSPYMATIEERSARSALDRLNQSMNTMGKNPSIGQLFKIRTDLGSLLKKIGLFDEGVARRSTRLGTVDTPTLKSSYDAINTQIDTLIRKTPYLDDVAKKKLLDFKNTSDGLYSSHMKAMNTTWVKSLYGESASAKGSLDRLMLLGRENRSQYDTIMENMSKTNQDGLEQSMVKRSLDKVRVGDDGYSIKQASDELLQLKHKFSNPEALKKLDAIVTASKIFEQDPVVSMISNHRMILDKLAKAGLTYNPKASLLYGMWSKTFPRVQTAFVNLVEKVPGLPHLMTLNPLYSSIKTSAREINVVGAAKHAFEKGEKTNFQNFLDRVLTDNTIPMSVRRSVEDISKQYAKLADSFQGNQDEIRAIMEAIEANPSLSGPLPPSAPKGRIEQLRKIGREREARELEQANRAREIAEAEREAVAANLLGAKRTRISELEAEVANLRAAQSANADVNAQLDEISTPTTNVAGFEEAEQVRSRIRGVLPSRDYAVSRNMREGTVTITDTRTGDNVGQYSVRTNADLDKALRDIEQRLGTGSPHPDTPQPFVPRPAVPTRSPMETAGQSISDSNPNMEITGNSGGRFTLRIRNPETGGLSASSLWTVDANGVIHGGTANLSRGSGVGSQMYHSVWDGARAGGLKAQPSGHLIGANPFRMSVNMLTYAAKNGGEAPHVLMQGRSYGGSRQVGVVAGGVDMRGQPLTRANVLQLADNIRTHINRNVLPTGVNISGRTSDKELVNIVRNLRGSLRSERSPIGLKTAKLIRDFLRSGRSQVTLPAAILGALMIQPDFINLVGGSNE